jgi:hypothetical protein
MTAAENRHHINLVCVGVPDVLKGAPLPVEIISQTGTRTDALLTLGDDRPTAVAVPGPGKYFVRTELPTGGWIAHSVIVPEPTQTGAETIPTATLDLSSHPPVPARWVQSFTNEVLGRQLELDPIGVLKGRFLATTRALNYAAPQQLPEIGLESLTPIAIDLRGGEFEQWAAAASAGCDLLRIKPYGVSWSIPGLPEHVMMQPAPSWVGGNPRDWRALLLSIELPATREAARRVLVVWPWFAATQSLLLLPDTPPDTDPDRPPLLAVSDTGNPTVNALFSYVRGGALESARLAAPALTAQAEQFLGQGTVSSPVLGCIAAYTLLKIGRLEHQDWIANLANWFPHIPDGAIAYGWVLLRAGKADEARQFFHKALERGIPMYTLGVRLLRDGLNFVRDLYPKDSQVQEDAARASRLVLVANFDSETTCLRLGDLVDVDFSQPVPGAAGPPL